MIAALELVPHPREGGHFVETYRAAEAVPAGAARPLRRRPRAAATAIYYLLTPTTFSALHRLRSDEVFTSSRRSRGDAPASPGWTNELCGSGPTCSPASGRRSSCRTASRGALLAAGGGFALLGCTVAPGFEYADYEDGRRDDLTAAYPAFADLIRALTPGS